MKKETSIRKKNAKDLKKAFREHLKQQEKKNARKTLENAQNKGKSAQQGKKVYAK